MINYPLLPPHLLKAQPRVTQPSEMARSVPADEDAPKRGEKSGEPLGNWGERPPHITTSTSLAETIAQGEKQQAATATVLFFLCNALRPPSDSPRRSGAAGPGGQEGAPGKRTAGQSQHMHTGWRTWKFPSGPSQHDGWLFHHRLSPPTASSSYFLSPHLLFYKKCGRGRGLNSFSSE